MLAPPLRLARSLLRSPRRALQQARHASHQAETAIIAPASRRPRRALLYLPGMDEKKAAKAAKLDVDCVCLDCEDAVAINRKQEARESIVELLQRLSFGRSDVAVRINSPDSGLAYDDLFALLSGPVTPDTIVVPKVDSAAQLEWVFEASETIIHKLGREKPDIALITQVESAMGLLNLRDICEVDRRDISSSSIFRHEGIILGGDDFVSSIGATRSKSNAELLYARQATVVHARAYGLDAIDIVNIHFKQPDVLEAEAREGAAMGFTGKQIIHPGQVDIVQQMFSPSSEQLDEAMAILTAFYEHEAKGTGAFDYQGKMIDMPTIKQCQNVTTRAVVTGLVAEDAVPKPHPPPVDADGSGEESSSDKANPEPLDKQ